MKTVEELIKEGDERLGEHFGVEHWVRRNWPDIRAHLIALGVYKEYMVCRFGQVWTGFEKE
jgi:hypothetical protein